jgi:ABC-type transport system involved in multi-copper enzyme maturation permease subunit
MGFIVCVILVSTDTVVLLWDYEKRLETYDSNKQEFLEDFREIRAYTELSTYRRLWAAKTPRLLSLLNEGVSRQMGDAVEVSYNRAPVFAEHMQTQKNPYLGIFPKIDLTKVFQIVMSLLALLFAYDSIAGERERGTLKLTLSNPLPRSMLLFGKYLGGVFSLFALLVMSMFISSLIILVSRKAEVSGEEWVRIGAFLLISFAYVSTSFTLGMLFSSIARRIATSLMIAMFFWVVFVVVWPHGSAYVVTQLKPLETSDPITYSGARRADVKDSPHLIIDMTRRFWRDAGSYGQRLGIETRPLGYRPLYFLGTDYGYDGYLEGTFSGSYNGPPNKKKDFERYFKLREELLIGLVDELEEKQRDYFMSNTVRQHRIAQLVSSISPSSAFASATAALAGTDMDSHLHFLNAAKQYRAELIQHLRNQNAFGSEKWYGRETFQDSDMEAIPIFQEQNESPLERLLRAAPSLIILVTYNTIFLLLSFIAFLRYDPR